MRFRWEEESSVIEPDSLFPRKANLTLEIGFGRGDFLVHYKEVFPEENLLGIEISKTSIRKAEKRLLGYPYCKLLLVESYFALGHLFPPNVFSKIFLLFPDPWPKKRHKKKRLINEEFVRRVAWSLKKDGLLFIISDSGDYVESAKFFFSSPYFILENPYPLYKDLAIQTKYAKKWKRLKRSFYSLQVRRTSREINRSWQQVLTGRKFDHLIVHMQGVPKFENFEIREKAFIFRIKEIFESSSGNLILWGVLVEETLIQNCLFYLKKREKDVLVTCLNNPDVVKTKGFFRVIEKISSSL